MLTIQMGGTWDGSVWLPDWAGLEHWLLCEMAVLSSLET